jgi:hypothetical protein
MDGIKNGVPQTFQERERLRESNNIQFVAEALGHSRKLQKMFNVLFEHPFWRGQNT